MTKLKMRTQNKADENYKKLSELFPNAVTETIDETTGEVIRAIDKDVLMQEINTHVVDGKEERYQFTWPDKKKSVLLANSPIAETLRPCREESVDFDNTENLYIEGDNLDVLKLLQETYLGKVKMIYIDPPYNTGNDFVYNDDFAENTDDYLDRSGQFDDDGNQLFQNTESNGRFHTDWLNMIYPRLKIARNLLSDDGVIFISIDDNEVENLIKIANEIFGENNILANLVWDLGTGTTAGHFTRGHEYILCYAKNKSILPNFKNFNNNEKIRHGALKRISTKNPAGEIVFPVGFEYEGTNAVFTGELGESEKEYILSKEMRFENGKLVSETRVKAGFAMKKQVEDYIAGKEVFDTKGQRVLKFYFNSSGILFYEKEKSVINPRTVISGLANTKNGSSELKDLFGEKYFEFPKPSALIEFLIRLITEKDSLILDFFSGSATTAHAVMQLNAEDGGHRKFIMVQLPEKTDEKSEAFKAGYKNICEIGKERIRRAGKKIKAQLMAEGKETRDIAEKKAQGNAVAISKAYWIDSPEYKSANKQMASDLDTGFRVLKLDSTNMKDVYYNPAEITIDTIMGTVDNIKEDRTPEDLLFQVMLDLGVLLSSKIEKSTIGGKTVFNVEDSYLIACFDDNVTDEVITAIAKQKPYYFVMRDSSMANDSVATNFEQIFAAYSPDTVRKVL